MAHRDLTSAVEGLGIREMDKVIREGDPEHPSLVTPFDYVTGRPADRSTRESNEPCVSKEGGCEDTDRPEAQDGSGGEGPIVPVGEVQSTSVLSGDHPRSDGLSSTPPGPYRKGGRSGTEGRRRG